jgi:nicotinamide mononucleotide adenylyltransferase
LRPVFDPQQPTALFVGRYQPFHDGHKALIAEGIRRVGQVCIGVRDTHGLDDKNPFGFEAVRSRIEHGLREFEGRFVVVPLPNITDAAYDFCFWRRTAVRTPHATTGLPLVTCVPVEAAQAK